MSYFPHNSQNFEDGFGNRQVPRGPPEMRNVQMRGPPLDQDINSRRFDPRNFSEHRQDPRNIEIRHGNPPDFGRMEQRIQPPGRGIEPPHRHADIRMDPRHAQPHPALEARGGDLRTYDRPPPNRVDPRINFSVGLPPPSIPGPSIPPPPTVIPHQNPPIHARDSGPSMGAQASMHHQHQPSHSSPLSLNSPFGPSLLSQFSNRQSVTEIVPVHVDLATFASEPKFQQILLKVKEQSSVNFISLNRISDDLVESIVIDAPTKEAAVLARNLIETHLKLQMKIKAAENRLQRVQTDLFSTQGEIAAGQMVEFMIRPELIGLAIGKKGARIKQIETETGVSSINVSDNGHIMIYGPDSQSVQRAREQLELQEDFFPLNHNQMDWMSDKMNSSVVADLKSGSGLMVAKVNRDTCKLDVVGTNASVQTAKFLLSTQLEYIDKQIEIEANEREAREKLNAVRKQYGLTNPQWKTRMARSGRSRSPEEGRRAEQTVQYESSRNMVNNNSNANVKGPNKGHDVVDTLVRAAMTGSVNSKGAKSNSDREREVVQGNKTELFSSNPDNAAPVSAEDELDALISYPTENQPNKKQNDPKLNNKRLVKDMAIQDTFMGTNIRDTDSDKVELKAGRGRDRDRDRGKDRGEKIQNNNRPNGGNNKNGNNNFLGGNSDANNRSGNQGIVSNAINSRGNRLVQEGNKAEKGNKKEKQAALKLINQTSSTDSAGMVVIPPAPVLVVPPPPPSLTAQNSTETGQKSKEGKEKKDKKRNKKHDVKVEEVELQDESLLGEEKKPAKEPMLVKLNNPFLEQKVKRSSDEQPPSSSRVVSIIPESAESSIKKQDSTEKRGRNRHDRSDSHDLTSAMAGLKVDSRQSPQHPDLKSESPPPGKANKRNKKKKGKGSEKDESPTDASAALKAFSVTELEGKILEPSEPPLPRAVKKGPPAIPNKVVVVDEPSGPGEKKDSRSNSLKDQEKPAKNVPAASLSVDTSSFKGEEGEKKLASPPGLTAPPGLAKTPTNPATSTATEGKPADHSDSGKTASVSSVVPSPAVSAPVLAPVTAAVIASPPSAPAPISSPSAGKRASSEPVKSEVTEASKDA